jgi:hypothetical protein
MSFHLSKFPPEENETTRLFIIMYQIYHASLRHFRLRRLSLPISGSLLADSMQSRLTHLVSKSLTVQAVVVKRDVSSIGNPVTAYARILIGARSLFFTPRHLCQAGEEFPSGC